MWIDFFFPREGLIPSFEFVLVILGMSDTCRRKNECRHKSWDHTDETISHFLKCPFSLLIDRILPAVPRHYFLTVRKNNFHDNSRGRAVSGWIDDRGYFLTDFQSVPVIALLG